MQLVAGGPDIPSALLQAHEEGSVVFFCGAGISYPAGLPGFRGLVDRIVTLLGTALEDPERDAYDQRKYDFTLDHLERRFPGGKPKVRGALAQALKPNLRRKGATDTHAALLDLARSRIDGAQRLVTSNFDRIFAGIKPAVIAHAAPQLPISKGSRWNGLVYLHGLLPRRLDEAALDRLVVTSGDFGRAYLTDGWAARFVSELFRNFVVCFVGYSIDDPVLRYMMDAVAAERRLGEIKLPAYAFGGFTPREDDGKVSEWEAKGVIPILYDGSNDHAALHCTLQAWAGIYRDGIHGLESIIDTYSLSGPSTSNQQDDFVGRMLWALSHKSGLPAQRFAEFDPAPPLEWLEVLAEDRFGLEDRARFDLPTIEPTKENQAFSLIHRPAPTTRAPAMLLVSNDHRASDWDKVMLHLARWLVRYLDEPKLILWLAHRGGRLHERFVWLIEGELERFDRLEREDKLDELEQIRRKSPSAIPRPLFRPLWRLLINNRAKSAWDNPNFYRWEKRLKRDGLTATLRFELRDLLAPKVVISEPWSLPEPGEPERLDQFFRCELALSGQHVYSAFERLNNNRWQGFLPALLGELQVLLLDGLELLREIGVADSRRDPSFWDLPSISPHSQNRQFREWVILIELLRDAWLGVREVDPVRAAQIAQIWFELPYPTFKRLALFAAQHDSCVAPDRWVDWLTVDTAWWLWAIETKRETMRLLILQGLHLKPEPRARLEAAILAGPPRTMYRQDTDQEDWQRLVDRSVWLRLAKLKASGGQPGVAAAARLETLSTKHPNWQIDPFERDEFSHWMSSSTETDPEENLGEDRAPRKRRELVAWLKRTSSAPQEQRSGWVEDDGWAGICRERFFHCALALSDLAGEGQWPAGRWRDALQAWSEEGRTTRSWRFLARVVKSMPVDVLGEISHSASHWLRSVSGSLERHEEVFLDLCRRILTLSHQDGAVYDEPLLLAINHPIGHVAEALLSFWLKRKPSDDDGLPTELAPFFSQICDRDVPQFRHGRVLLASRLIFLFRVDRPWTEIHLLPLFDWTIDSEEARAVWSGFLWSPRLFQPLLIAFKVQFLETTNHIEELGEQVKQFVSFLTSAALNSVETYTVSDFRNAFSKLPQAALEEAAFQLLRELAAAGGQTEEFWDNRIAPFWQQIWPKNRDLISRVLADSLARLSISARGRFPIALEAVSAWLQPLEHPDFVVGRLHEADLARRFPKDALRLLSAVLDDQPWAPRELRECLDAISQTAPELAQDLRFRKLDEYARQHGI